MLKKKNNKKYIINLIKKIIEEEIDDIEEASLCKLEKYDFNICKLNVVNKLNEHEDIYVKLIDKNRIKESVFFYWEFLYTNRKDILNKIDIDRNICNENKKVKIGILDEKKSQNYKRNVSIKINEFETLPLYIVELKDYIKENFSEKLLYNIESNIYNLENYFLLVGIVK